MTTSSPGVLIVGMEVGCRLPNGNHWEGRIVEIREPIVALSNGTINTHEEHRRNLLVWPNCPEDVLLLHKDYVKEVL